MSYQCPKGHMSADPDYCSECGARIGKTAAPDGPYNKVEKKAKEEICPDCGTPRAGNARFCEVCRHDFVEGKTGTAEKVVAESQGKDAGQPSQSAQEPIQDQQVPSSNAVAAREVLPKEEAVIPQKLDIIISVDKNRLSANTINTGIKPDTVERVFPLDLDENLVGRRSNAKGIYPEIEINDPGVSHRHLKFIKQHDGSFAVLELGSANGTELNGVQLEPGISTIIKAGDEFSIGLWTTLKVAPR